MLMKIDKILLGLALALFMFAGLVLLTGCAPDPDSVYVQNVACHQNAVSPVPIQPHTTPIPVLTLQDGRCEALHDKVCPDKDKRDSDDFRAFCRDSQ